MLEEAKTLVQFTKGTRDDCHECDEQGLSFVGCVGTQLDNAFGEQLDENAIVNGFQEVVLLLKRERTPYKFNLATLLAFAKVGDEAYRVAKEVAIANQIDEIKIQWETP